MSGDVVRTKIANVTLNLPIYRDKKTTLEIAESVGELVAQMETRAERIDSQAFALLAAYEFARRLKALEDDNEADTRDLLKALDGIAGALNRLVAEQPSEE